jgi:hypothetical protein
MHARVCVCVCVCVSVCVCASAMLARGWPLEAGERRGSPSAMAAPGGDRDARDPWAARGEKGPSGDTEVLHENGKVNKLDTSSGTDTFSIQVHAIFCQTWSAADVCASLK